MKTPSHVIEVYLQPGEWWFGDRDTRIRTVLGSCVSIVLWHPRRHIGGMCHYMLPGRTRKAGQPLDGRYADEAMQLLVADMAKADTRPQEYVAKLFGGGSMFSPADCHGTAPEKKGQVHDRNVEAGRALVARYGFQVRAEHLGGCGHRQLVFDIWSGHAWLKHTPLSAAAGAHGEGERR